MDAVLDAVHAGRAGPAFAWAGLAVDIYPGSGFGPGFKVAWESVRDLETHWPGVALELTSRIREKAGKQYPVPTIAVVDITRLGESSKWALETLPADMLISQVTPELAGHLAGVAVVRAGFLEAAGFEVAATWRNPSGEGCDEAPGILRAIARPALPLAIARHVKASVPAGTLRSWIAGELLAVGLQRRAEIASRTSRFTGNVAADELLRTEPLAALAASCASSGGCAPARHGKSHGWSSGSSVTLSRARSPPMPVKYGTSSRPAPPSGRTRSR